MLSDLERLRNAIDTGDAKYYSGDIKRGLIWALNDLIELTEGGDEDILFKGMNAAETIATLKSEKEAYRSAIKGIVEARKSIDEALSEMDANINPVRSVE